MRLAFVLSAALMLTPPVALAQRGARNPAALIREGELTEANRKQLSAWVGRIYNSSDRKRVIDALIGE